MSLSVFFHSHNFGVFASRVGRCVQICALVIFTASSPIFAQEPSNDDEVLKFNTELLVFPIRVRGKNKQPVETLHERDLVLKDQDAVTTGLYLSRGVDRVSLVFALDQSGSVRDIISQQRNAALELFSRFGDRSQIAVLRFAERPAMVVSFGRDATLAREAFNFPVAANQRTAIFDAAVAAITSLESLPPVRSERRIVILMSDGLDNASRVKPSSVVESAIANRVSFYVIHLPLFEPRDGRLVVRSPAKGFRDLAEKTGGKYFLAGDARSALTSPLNVDLAPVFQSIEEDLRSQFLLGFYLNESANDGRRHQFSLSMPDGVEYQVSGRGFERTQKFFVANPRKVLSRPR
jgi:VWFA-related protein